MALFVTMFGFAIMLNEVSFGKYVFYAGLVFLAIVIFKWFADVVNNTLGFNIISMFTPF